MTGITEYFLNQSVKAVQVPVAEAKEKITADAKQHDCEIMIDGKRVLPEALTEEMVDGSHYIELIGAVLGG